MLEREPLGEFLAAGWGYIGGAAEDEMTGDCEAEPEATGCPWEDEEAVGGQRETLLLDLDSEDLPRSESAVP